MAGLIDAIESSGLLALVSKSAPVLGTILGSPLAGVGVSLLAALFHCQPKDINSIMAAASADPDADAKLKQLELEHSETLAAIFEQNYGIEVEDRMSARQAAPLYKDFLRHMAYLVTCGFFGALILMFFPLPMTNSTERELLSMLIGMLVSKWQTIIDFYYGSSSSKQGGSKNE